MITTITLLCQRVELRSPKSSNVTPHFVRLNGASTCARRYVQMPGEMYLSLNFLSKFRLEKIARMNESDKNL